MSADQHPKVEDAEAALEACRQAFAPLGFVARTHVLGKLGIDFAASALALDPVSVVPDVFELVATELETMFDRDPEAAARLALPIWTRLRRLVERAQVKQHGGQS